MKKRPKNDVFSFQKSFTIPKADKRKREAEEAAKAEAAAAAKAAKIPKIEPADPRVREKQLKLLHEENKDGLERAKFSKKQEILLPKIHSR